MSREDKVCAALLSTYNEDVVVSGRIRYDLHEAFSRVGWRSVDLDEKNYPTYGCSQLSRAFFDIDNDGKDELVVKFSACFRSSLTDSLYVFPRDSDVLTKLRPGEGGLAPLFATPHQFNRNTYELAALDTKPTIGGHFILQPFTYDRTVYISMTDLEQKWIVIAKYRRDKGMQDVCYFHRPERH